MSDHDQDQDKKEQNNHERAFKAKQFPLLFPSLCPLEQWTRLRVKDTNEGISFFLRTPPTHQITLGLVWGAIPFEELNLPPNSFNRWVRASLLTGKTIWFYYTDLDETRLYRWGWIYTPEYLYAECGDVPVAPNIEAGSWNTNLGPMVLIQSGPLNYRIQGEFAYDDPNPGRIPYATIWREGRQNVVYGQWRQGGETGRFVWRLTSDLLSFTGTRGIGDNYTNRGTWSGIRRR